MNFTKQQRHLIYKEALSLHKEDVIDCTQIEMELYDIYFLLRKASCVVLNRVSYIEDYPELIEMKPEDKTMEEDWWPELIVNATVVKGNLETLIEQTK